MRSKWLGGHLVYPCHFAEKEMESTMSTAAGECSSSRDIGVKAPPYSCQVPPWDCHSLFRRGQGTSPASLKFAWTAKPSWFPCLSLQYHSDSCLSQDSCKQILLGEAPPHPAQAASFPGKRGTQITNLASQAPNAHAFQQSGYSAVLLAMKYTVQELDKA